VRLLPRYRRTVVITLVALALFGSPGRQAHGVGAITSHTASVVALIGSWQWPVGGPRVVVRPYLAPATPWGAGHRGIDIETVGRATDDTALIVLAPDDGVVHFAGTVVNRPVLSIEHAGGLLSSYEPVATELRAGQRVHKGDPIGILEAGHCAVITCLHFGVRLGGEYVSPLLLLGGVPRAVLVPTRDE
jgi:murein DD-endopeptidase MepM/ murein hydrolase activator NlpD